MKGFIFKHEPSHNSTSIIGKEEPISTIASYGMHLMFTFVSGSNPVLAHPLEFPLLPDLVPLLEFLLPSSWSGGGGLGLLPQPPNLGLKNTFECWDNL